MRCPECGAIAGHASWCSKLFRREPGCDCPSDVLYAFGHQPECKRKENEQFSQEKP